MYKATKSFIMNKEDYEDIDVKKGEILAENFVSQEIIEELLDTGHIVEYDGSLEITENGTYNVKDYDSADVNVTGSAILQNKQITITENTTTTIEADSNYDGLGVVEVITNVSGADLSEYFDTNITTQSGFYYSNIKKLPSLTIDDRLTSLDSYFGSWSVLEEIENISGGTNISTYRNFLTQCRALKKVNFNNFNTSSSTSFSGMFNGCGSLTNLDLSSFTSTNVTETSFMFLNCKLLTHLDIRNMTFDSVTTPTRMFGNNASEGVPDNCEIIVKSQTEKEWITSKFSRLTNVKTVAEL